MITKTNLQELLQPSLGATVVSIPFLTPQSLSELQQSAFNQITFRQTAQRVGAVEQHFVKCTEFTSDSVWMCFAKQLSLSIQNSCRHVDLSFAFNEFSLHHYYQTPENKPYSIGPHRDFKLFTELIGIFLVHGQSNFFIAQDKSGTDAVEIKANPGQLILMRGENFGGCGLSRPIHFVGPVGSEGRISFGLRQIVNTQEAQDEIERRLG